MLISLHSMLNPTGFEQDLSQVDFQEDEERQQESESLESESRKSIPESQSEEKQWEKENEQPTAAKGKEYNKINNILDKFETMSRRFSHSHRNFLQEQPNI